MANHSISNTEANVGDTITFSSSDVGSAPINFIYWIKDFTSEDMDYSLNELEGYGRVFVNYGNNLRGSKTLTFEDMCMDIQTLTPIHLIILQTNQLNTLRETPIKSNSYANIGESFNVSFSSNNVYYKLKYLCKHWFYTKSETESRFYTKSETDSMMNNLIDSIYPVGSIYMSVNSTSPATLFGGTWEQIEDRFLLASGTTYGGGSTGGAATVALTKEQMPRHNHTQAQHRHKQTNKYSDGTGSAGAYMYTSNRTAVDHYTDYQTPVINHTGGTGTTNADANGAAHENMPPYLAVYVWKRTA